MANVLNKFFTSVFTIENPDILDAGEYGGSDLLTDAEFPEESIKKKINAIKPTAAFGPDQIGPRLLQVGVDVLCTPLRIILERSLEEGVPTDWRNMVNVTPIYKGGSKMQSGNYRPVSLTCISYGSNHQRQHGTASNS